MRKHKRPDVIPSELSAIPKKELNALKKEITDLSNGFEIPVAISIRRTINTRARIWWEEDAYAWASDYEYDSGREDIFDLQDEYERKYNVATKAAVAKHTKSIKKFIQVADNAAKRYNVDNSKLWNYLTKDLLTAVA